MNLVRGHFRVRGDTVDILPAHQRDEAVRIEFFGDEIEFKYLCEETGLKIGDVMLPFRIMLVGGKFGPHVFDIAALLGKEETVKRIEVALGAIAQ